MTTCQHGHIGYCHDEATSAERQVWAALERHAHVWAREQGLDQEDAEHYAAAFASARYDQPAEDWGGHSLDYVPGLAVKYPNVN